MHWEIPETKNFTKLQLKYKKKGKKNIKHVYET